MGSRAYLIKKKSKNSYKYTYAHCGASKFKKLTDEHYHSEKEITDQDIKNRFNNIWKHSKKKGEDLKTTTSLSEIIDVEQITIEAYIIQDSKEKHHVVLPTITSEVNVAVASQVDTIHDLHQLRNLHRHIEDYIRTAEKQGLSESTIKEGVRLTVSERHTNNQVVLIEENENPERRVFSSVFEVKA